MIKYEKRSLGKYPLTLWLPNTSSPVEPSSFHIKKHLHPKLDTIPNTSWEVDDENVDDVFIEKQNTDHLHAKTQR